MLHFYSGQTLQNPSGVDTLALDADFLLLARPI
jgi:hypothetical protein